MSKVFKTNSSFDERKEYSKLLGLKFPDRVPVIVDADDDLKIEKTKFLIPRSKSIGEFLFLIRKKIKLKKEEALYIFVNNQIPRHSKLMSEIFQEHKSACGFLFVELKKEATFGDQ